MNVLYKFYCRAYQSVLRMALPFLPYREPKIIYNKVEIADYLKVKNCKRLLFVTDEGIRKHGVTKEIEDYLMSSGFELFVYDGTRVNPTVENVESALKIYKEEKCEAIIAMGGGSSMDLAKGVGARVAYPDKSLNKMEGILKVLKKTPLLIAIPTTAGTGSEATITAVITDEKTKHKYTINSFPLMPDVALLDARATFTLPQSVTAGCGMDVLCHAVEAYIGNSTTAFTRKCALEASKMVFDNLLIAYHEPQNYEARKNMLIASYKAGVAFSRSYVGYIHAIAHSLGGEYGIAHGRANAIIMPLILRGYGNCIYNKIKQMAVYCEMTDENASEEEAFEVFVSRIENMIKEMNIEDIKVVEEKDIDKLVNYAYKEATPLYPVPRFMDKEELSGYYMRMMEDEN